MKQVFLLGETLSKMRQNKIKPREELSTSRGFLF
jgi:hypothetical protein